MKWLGLVFLLTLSVATISCQWNASLDFSHPTIIKSFPRRAVEDSGVTFPSNWDILAPFAAGTREFGEDPLEAFGGIRKLWNDRKLPNQKFPSELVFGGYVGWTTAPGGNNVAVNIQWNESVVNWPLIEAWGGLTVSQFQGWAVGVLKVNQPGTYQVSCVGVTSFWIGDTRYRGDVYGLGYGIGAVEFPTAGVTQMMYVPFSGMENSGFQCSISSAPSGPLMIINDHIIPDIVTYSSNSGTKQLVAGGHFAISVLNLYNRSLKSISITTSDFTIAQQFRPDLEAHQQGAINFKADHLPTCYSATNTTTIRLTLTPQGEVGTVVQLTIGCRSWGLPYAFTFLDADNSVQYAAARPPAQTCIGIGACPVLFTFHGAGVYARKDAWVYAYQQQKRSWLLFPTNRRQFGFDWEGPGRINAWKALDALAANMPGVPTEMIPTYRVDPYKIQYAGHSMGGHGCWYISTHSPDRALSVSPAAGWIKMDMYIPFFARPGSSLADPQLLNILMSAISMHNADWYMRHLNGIPLMVRMGADDNTVPPFHLKRMARLHNQLAHSPQSTEVSEVPGQGHWWSGVVDDAQMQSFFDAHWSLKLPPLPDTFTVNAMSTIDFEGRGGIQIWQTLVPGRAAKVHVIREGSHWRLTTSNVNRFTFYKVDTMVTPETISIDGGASQQPVYTPAHFCRKSDATWATCSDSSFGLTEKSPGRSGPMSEILEGPIVIVRGTKGPQSLIDLYSRSAVTLANDLYYQGRYTPRIVTDEQALLRQDLYQSSNLIVFGGPTSNSFTQSIQEQLPVQFFGQDSFEIGRKFSHTESGVAFLSPRQHAARLNLVLHGNSEIAFGRLLSVIPTKSSVTVPDWIVTGPEFGWNGAAGLLGAGYYDNNWKYDDSTSWISVVDQL